MKTVKHSLIRLFAVVTAITVLSLGAGCAPTAPSPPAPGERPAAAALSPTPAVAKGKYGGVLQFSQMQTLTTLNPFSGGSLAEQAILGPVYDTLIKYKYEPGGDYRIDFALAPSLAERWEIPNPTTYIFYLRKDVKWQDGTEFSADDVVWTYNFVRDPKNPFPRVDYEKKAESVEKLDKYTVKITTKTPDPDYLIGIGDRIHWILPKHVADRGDSYTKVVVGSGPFKLKSYDPTKGASLVKNENYWEKDLPYMDRIEIFIGMDASAQMAAFIAKEIDILNMPNKRQFDQIKAVVPNLSSGKFYSSYGNSLYLRVDKPPFNDVRVRRAMNLAIDRQEMIKVAGGGEGVINPPGGVPGMKTGWVLPGLENMPGFRQPKDQDIAEAKRLLAEAGYPNGFKTTIKYLTTRTTSPPASELAAGQLKRIGIEMELRGGTDRAAFDKDEKEGNFEISASLVSDPSPWQRLNQYFHSKGELNGAKISDPKLDDLIEKAATEIDVNKAKQLYHEMQRILLDNAYVIPTIDFGVFPVWQPYVNRYTYNIGTQTYAYDTQYTWLDVDKMPKR